MQFNQIPAPASTANEQHVMFKNDKCVSRVGEMSSPAIRMKCVVTPHEGSTYIHGPSNVQTSHQRLRRDDTDQRSHFAVRV